MATKPTDAHILDRLFATVAARRGVDPRQSYTATLLAGGVALPARKLGEEAVEAVIAAMAGDAEALARESADLLYHLLVLWAAAGLEPERIYAVLAAREGISGIAEKAARGAAD